MGKWDPLTDYLAGIDKPRIVLSYEEIQAILGAPLPRSATEHRPYFWANAKDGHYAQAWLRAGYRASLRGLGRNEVAFERNPAAEPTAAAGQPARPSTDEGQGQPVESEATVILVGCVKTKASSARPARDLYLSPQFLKGRAYAEASGKPWAVLSSQYGLVLPDVVIEPYDLALSDARPDYLRQWGDRVLRQLVDAFGPLDGQVIEILAPKTYVEPLLPRLRAAGARVLWPFKGLRQGEQLAWYDHPGRPAASAEPTTGSRGGRAAAPTVRSRAALDGDRAGSASAHRGPAADSGMSLAITQAFQRGELDLGARHDAPPPGWSSMPEVAAVTRLREQGADDVTVRRFCTFMMAMDRARDADQLWQRGVELFVSAPSAFAPRDVASRRLLDLADMLRRFGVSQRHGADAAAWRTIAEALGDPWTAPAVHTAIHEGRGDAQALLEAVVETTPLGTPYFPLLSGPKIAPVWVRILAYPGGAQISGLASLPVGVDVQVRKVSEYLGVTDTHGLSVDHARPIIQRVWREEVQAHGADGPAPLTNTPAALDPALWFYGKWGCTRCERALAKLPISPLCQGCRLGAADGPDPNVPE